MIQAFLFLSLRTFKNRLLAQLRRLKRPKYLVFALIGGAYFYLVAGRHWVAGLRFSAKMNQHVPPAELVEVAAALFVIGSIAVAWCAPSPVSPLTFTEAEIQYLFPAPVPRRSLVKWKLMRGQLGVIVSLLFFTAVSGPYLAVGSRGLFLAGAWVAFATMQFHLTGIRMARHTLQRRNIGWGTRTAVAAVLIFAAVAVCGVWAARNVGPPDLAALKSFDEADGLVEYASRLFGSGPAWLLLSPARLLVRPALAPDVAAFLFALPAALALLLGNYAWVLRSGVVPEEGALAAARRLEEMKEAQAQGRLGRVRRVRATPAPFRLAPTGRPEVALMWKNLICSLRMIGGLRTIAWLIPLCLVPALLSMIARGKGVEVVSQILGVMFAMSALSLLLVGPSILRSDFRQDLLQIDLLKTYPISGRTLLVGTLLAPVLILTLIEWGLFAGFAILTTSPLGGILPANVVPTALALTGVILAPAMNMVSAIIHNAALLLVPGWVSLGLSRTTGVERIGQGMLTTLGFLLAMALIVLPAAVIFGITWFFSSYFVGGMAALPVSALPAAAVLSAEAWVGSAALGAYLDRFDPSRELDSVTRS